MNWDERARRDPDSPLSPQEAQDYLGHLVDQYNHRTTQPAKGGSCSPGAVGACWVVVFCAGLMVGAIAVVYL